MVSHDFSGKVALVTGGASGIGEACVKQFAAGGAAVVIADIDVGAGAALAAAIAAAGGRSVFIETDVADADSARAAAACALAQFGRLDCAVNSAGITGATSRLTDYSVDAWRRVLDINLHGVFHGMRSQIDAMLPRLGAGDGGAAIVNMASVMGLVSTPPTPAYTAAKHAVIGMTLAAAQSYAAHGLRINAICPGYIQTPMMMNGTTPEMREKLTRRHPIGRLGQADEIAAAALFLCSDAAAFMAGGVYPVDGGYLVN